MAENRSASSSINRRAVGSNCTVCPCEGHGHSDICFVEGALYDKNKSINVMDISTSVWQGIKPPDSFGTNSPYISARRVCVIRAQLTGKLDPPKSVIPRDAMEHCFSKL